MLNEHAGHSTEKLKDILKRVPSNEENPRLKADTECLKRLKNMKTLITAETANLKEQMKKWSDMLDGLSKYFDNL
jgi:hypothetical protein